MMIDTLTSFYTVHYNFGLVAIFMLLIAIYLASKKNGKGVVVMLCLLLVYNLILYNKAKHDPKWYDKTEAKIKAYDPVKEAWDKKEGDDDPDKRK